MKNIIELLGEPRDFLDSIFEGLDGNKVDVTNYELDHICYRVSTTERYEELKTKVLEYGDLLIENLISGRMIATYKLKEPIVYNNREIYVLELPSPKEGSHYNEGYEHIELVIDKSFEDFMNQYSELDFITKDINKENNPDIKLQFNIGSVKFHRDTLENVIENEQK